MLSRKKKKKKKLRRMNGLSFHCLQIWVGYITGMIRAGVYRFKGLDLIECLKNYGWRFVTLYRRQ